MKTNIFIPSQINVGFQNRKDTYTGKLAYVIYFDEKGKLRKETSWNSWRDSNIPNEIYDNEPTEGFVLNKKVGGTEESYGWDVRKTYTRIYDPRGFEFEITIPNLLWILENCNCIKGKGLEGKFVYGWDGKELVLVPIDSPDYKEIQEKNKIIHNNEFIKAKDLILGATYETLNGDKYIYMGKYDVYEHEINYYYESNYSHRSGFEYPDDNSWHFDSISNNSKSKFRPVNKGKYFYFISPKDPNSTSYWNKDQIAIFKNITRKFSSVVSTECEKYSEYYDMITKSSIFSPIDYDKNKILPIEYKDFYNKLSQHMINDNPSDFIFYYLDNNKFTMQRINYHYGEHKYYYRKIIGRTQYGMYSNEYIYDNNKIYIDINSIKEIYDKFKPVYGEQYLENGKLYLRRGYYGAEE